MTAATRRRLRGRLGSAVRREDGYTNNAWYRCCIKTTGIDVDDVDDDDDDDLCVCACFSFFFSTC